MNTRPVVRSIAIIAKIFLMSCKKYQQNHSSFARSALTRLAEKSRAPTLPGQHPLYRKTTLKNMGLRSSRKLKKGFMKRLQERVQTTFWTIKPNKNRRRPYSGLLSVASSSASRFLLQLRPSNGSIVTSISSGKSMQFRLTLKESGWERGT